MPSKILNETKCVASEGEKKKKRRKKKKSKQRSSSDAGFDKTTKGSTRSIASCPPFIETHKVKSTNLVHIAEDDKLTKLNQNLRWLSMIAAKSNVVSTTKSFSISPNNHISTKLAQSVISMVESPSDEEERLVLYKLDRRKRYMAKQQLLLMQMEDKKLQERKRIVSDDKNASKLLICNITQKNPCLLNSGLKVAS